MDDKRGDMTVRQAGQKGGTSTAGKHGAEEGQVLRPVDIEARGKKVLPQAQTRRPLACRSEYAGGAPGNTGEELGLRAAEADQVVAPVGRRSEHEIRFSAEHRRRLVDRIGGDMRCVGPDHHDGRRPLAERIGDRAGHALTQVSPPLGAAAGPWEQGWKWRLRWPVGPGHLVGKRLETRGQVLDERRVERAGPIGTERRHQPGFHLARRRMLRHDDEPRVNARPAGMTRDGR